MANFTKTITNSVNLFGGSRTSKWGSAVLPYTMTWGTTKWGEGTFSLVFSVQKVITNSLSPTTDLSKGVRKIITNTFSAAGAMTSEILTNGTWRVVFVSDTVNVQDRDSATWASGAANSASYTCAAAGSTTWT